MNNDIDFIPRVKYHDSKVSWDSIQTFRLFEFTEVRPQSRPVLPTT